LGLVLFFVLSKTLGVILVPSNLLILLGVAGVVLLATRWAPLGRKLVAASVALIAVCAFSPLGNILLYPLEQRFPPWDPAQGPPDGIIVLGGPIDADISVARDMPVVRSSPDRFFAAVVLAHRYPGARIVYTGGSANLISNDAREADFAGELLADLGIDRTRLIMERRSRNTYENAVFTKALLAPKPGERWLLVTSAYHMPRSVGLFRKVGFAIEPYPVDWRVGGRADLLNFSFTPGGGLGQTDTAMREWLGLLAYRLTGRIDEWFPGPAER